MTTKELINQYVTAHAENRWMDASELEALLTEFAEKLKEPASKDLEKESDIMATKLFKEFFPQDGDTITPNDFCKGLRSFAHHFAEWQREQMMKDAIDGEVNIWGSHISLLKVLPSEFSKQKVKMIIIKE